MKNIAEIKNDGACVYLDSSIKPDRNAKITLLLINVFFFTIFGIIVYASWAEKMSLFTLFAVYLLLPAIYGISLGRLTLWNLFGREYVIINTKSVSFRRYYGIFTSKLKVLPYKGLHYAITETVKYAGIPYGTINFAHHNQQGHSINLFTTSITLPIKQLNKLVDQVKFLFTLEQISDPEYEVIHLN